VPCTRPSLQRTAHAENCADIDDTTSEVDLFMTAPVQSKAAPAVFLLERFAWDGPDRLRVSGRWEPGESPTTEPAMLVVRSGDATHRLPALAEPCADSRGDGRRWSATFAWPHGPAAFEGAVLEIGGELIIELPQPRPKRLRRSHRRLQVRCADHTNGSSPAGAIAGVAHEAELVLAREEILSLRASVERLEQQLDRACVDVESERRGRSADAESFRHSLADLRTTAEQALEAERITARRLGRELEEARQRLADQDAQLTELQRVATDADRQRSVIDSARAQTEQLLAELTALRDTLAHQTHS
jgi:HAMP domain-containing protein